MKVTKLEIKNVGMIADAIIPLDKPLILFYGEIRQGKTTILNAVRYVFGGSFPADIIRHGEDKAFIQIDFENGYVRREFYRSEAGPIQARPVVLVMDGVRVPSPVGKLKKFLNPFLLDQEHIIRMSELERQKFFAELFQTATPELDRENAVIGQEAIELRIAVKAAGDIEPVAIARVDVGALREKRAAIVQRDTLLADAVKASNLEIEKLNDEIKSKQSSLTEWDKHINQLQAALETATTTRAKVKSWLDLNQVRDPHPAHVFKDVSALDTQISEALATNVRAEQDEKDAKRLKQRNDDHARVLEIDARRLTIRDLKIARLDEISAKCGVPGLKFVDNGDFVFEETTAGMLSTSQLMRLSQLLSALYPDGLGVDLIDKGESLGKSIFDFVERAKREDKTILASIVGERPASVPENVGVFVVENGKLS